MNIEKLIKELEELRKDNPDLHVFVLVNGEHKNITLIPTKDSDCYPTDLVICPV